MLCACILLAMKLWTNDDVTNQHSSMQMKGMYTKMASMVWVPISKRFSWEEN